MSTRHDSTSRWEDTPLRIVSHRLEVTNSAASRSDNQPAKNGATRTQTAGGHGVRPSQLRQIVLVDRDIDALRDVAVALRDQFDFHVTISGNEALNLLQGGSIDAIVVGQTLYSSTGLNVLAEARRRAPHTQRILLANAVEATDIERASAQARPFRILPRPCTAQKLLELLEGADDDAADTNDATDPVATPPRQPATQVKPSAAPAPQPAPVQKIVPTIRRNPPPVFHGDYEHVVLET